MFVPVNEPLLRGNERKYLNECVDSGWIGSEGPFVQQFEQQMAVICGRTHGIAVSNGSVALDTAIQALNLPRGSEIILPSFTIISCAGAVVRCGHTPVVVDSDALTWNMDTTKIEERITPKTKAILMVHIYGIPTDIDAVLAIAQKYNLYVIEDAAEQIGQRYKGRVLGSFGDLSTLSFYPNKHITTGEGGMVLTNSDHLAARAKAIRNLSFVPEKRFVHYELSNNYRMSNLQAAVGVAQLEQLAGFVDIKRRVGRLYNELLKDLIGKYIAVQPALTDCAENIYWVYGVVLMPDVAFEADEAMKKLAALGVACRPFFYPMHQQPVFIEMGLFAGEKLLVAENLAARGFYLPSGMALTETQIRYVAKCLHEIFV